MFKKLFIMSTTILNFKKIEIAAANREEAVAQIEANYFHISGDATQAFKNWKSKQTGGVTERAIKEFMLDYLNKKGKNCPGSGYMITVDSAISDTRERPYSIEDIPNEGRRKYKKTYQLVDVATGVVLGETKENKAVAKQLAKEIIKGGFKGKMNCNLVHKVTEGQETVFTAEYTPSKNTKNGTWIAFGIEA